MCKIEPKPKLLTVSVVIITRNRPKELASCIEALMEQTQVPQEIIVVDDSDAGVTDRARARFDTVLWVDGHSKHGRTNGLRNLGVRRAQGEVIAFLDDDSIAEPGWLEHLLAGFGNVGTGAVGGRVVEETSHVVGNGRIGVFRRGLSPQGNFFLDPGKPIAVEHMRTCNLAVSRKVLKEIGGFEEAYTGMCLRDDSDLCLQIKKAGYTLVFDARAVVRHLASGKAGGFTRTTYALSTQYDNAKNHSFFVIKNRQSHGREVVYYFVIDTSVGLYQWGRSTLKRFLLWLACCAGKVVGICKAICILTLRRFFKGVDKMNCGDDSSNLL